MNLETLFKLKFYFREFVTLACTFDTHLEFVYGKNI